MRRTLGTLAVVGAILAAFGMGRASTPSAPTISETARVCAVNRTTDDVGYRLVVNGRMVRSADFMPLCRTP